MEEHTNIGIGEDAIERLRQRAARLDAARHPGVVELLGFSESEGVGELRTVAVDGPTLAESVPLEPEEVAGLAAAIATTLADLHERGIVHGALEPAHVLIDRDGRPVVCGLAGRPPDGATAAADVGSLGAMVAALVTDGTLAELAGWATHPDPLRRPSARGLAAAISNRVPGARLPGAPATTATDDPPHPSPSLADLLGHRPQRRRPRLLIAGLIVACVAGTALVLARAAGGGDREATAVAPPTQPRPSPTTLPAPVQVWPPTSVGPAPTVGRDGRTWQVGAPGDLVVVSPWGCAAESTAALLRPQTGEVWYFPRWAGPGEQLDAVAVATVAGGRSAAARDVDGDGCAELVVDRSDAEPVVVHPEVGA